MRISGKEHHPERGADGRACECVWGREADGDLTRSGSPLPLSPLPTALQFRQPRWPGQRIGERASECPHRPGGLKSDRAGACTGVRRT